MIESGLVALLSDLADVHPVALAAEASLPAIVYRRVSTVSNQTHDGPSNLKSSRFQFSAHAATHLSALNLANSVATRLEGYTGTVGGQTVDNAELSSLFDLGYFDPSWQVAVDIIFYTSN